MKFCFHSYVVPQCILSFHEHFNIFVKAIVITFWCLYYTGATCLHLAALNGCIEVISWLLENACADLKRKTRAGSLPIHWAARGGQIEVVRYLVEQKCVSIDVRRCDGKYQLGTSYSMEVLDSSCYIKSTLSVFY